MKKIKLYVLYSIYLPLNLLRNLYFKMRYSIFRLKYQIDKTFLFNGIDIDFYGNGQIIIDENSYIGNRSYISSDKGQKVVIGKNCSISHNVRIYTMNRVATDIINMKEIIGDSKGDVIIGDNCWIGSNVFINQGITLGNNVVVGANSVITKSFPSNVIIAGCPAIIKKTL